MTARNEDFLFAQEAEKLGYVSEQQVVNVEHLAPPHDTAQDNLGRL